MESDDVDSTCYELYQRCECSREDWPSLLDAPRHGQKTNSGPHYPLREDNYCFLLSRENVLLIE